jgi:hypothetical protein
MSPLPSRLGAGLVQDGAVDLDATRSAMRLGSWPDEAGDDVDRRALRGQDQVQPAARAFCAMRDADLDLLRRHHHQGPRTRR